MQIALAQLSDNERQLMEYLYLFEKPGTVRGYEKKTGISKSVANRWRQSALVKLKKFFEA